MHATTKAKSLSALDGMREIVRREMLVMGDYVENEVSNPRYVGAVCGGRKHCAIGSLWAGAGVRLICSPHSSFVGLPGVLEYERPRFLRSRHGLRAAYDALNVAASTFADAHGIDLTDEDHEYFGAAIEGLFEGHYGSDLSKRDLLGVIAAAKRQIKNAA